MRARQGGERKADSAWSTESDAGLDPRTPRSWSENQEPDAQRIEPARCPVF